MYHVNNNFVYWKPRHAQSRNARKIIWMFSISELLVGAGYLGICPLPGRFSSYNADLATILEWRPNLVISAITWVEFASDSVSQFPEDLNNQKIKWMHFPVTDYGTPQGAAQSWTEISDQAHGILDGGGRVLTHCYGGCGRSGMVFLRLMREAGNTVELALERLREVRPCAVETAAQKAWAAETPL